MHRGFPIFSLATLPIRALFTAILLRWCMGHHVAATDKRRIALLSNYEATPASIKAAPSGRPASAAFWSTNVKHVLAGRLEEPFEISHEALIVTAHSSSGMILLIVTRHRDILELQNPSRKVSLQISMRDIVKQKNKKKILPSIRKR